MKTRRVLLRAAAAGALLPLSRGVTPAEQTSDPEVRLPPSIGALSSVHDQATPITVEERKARIAKAQRLMEENKLDAILLTGGTSLRYFTGVEWWPSERLFATVLPAKGRAFAVCPAFEEARAREQLDRGPLEGATVMTWQEDANPFAAVAAGLRSLGKTSGRLGIEERTPWVFSDEIGKAAPSLHLTSATPVTAGCRMVKSVHELALMQLANQATLSVYEAVFHALEPGMTQVDASRLIASAYKRIGFPGDASVQVGPWSANPHGSSTPQIIRENSIVMIDDGCTVEGYNSDITRTFVLGRATDKMKQVFDVVHRAQQAAFDAAKPGVACQTVDAAARKIICDAGYGPDYKFFSHRVGHGIGMDGHEWPYLVRGNTLRLEPGMTFSDEPGIYITSEFGVRLEDDIHITDTGAAWFTTPSPSLEQPFS